MQKGDIGLFKLTTGEEIVAEVVGTGNGDWFELKNVVMVGFMPRKTPMDQPMVGMAPWIPYRDTDEDVRIFREHIMLELKPSLSLIENYKKQFSPVIQPSTLIIPSR